MDRYLRLPLLILLLLASAAHGFAQRGSPSPPSPPDEKDLQETIEWLGVQLRHYGEMTLAYPSQPGTHDRISFEGMRADGCKITYRIKYVRTYPPSSLADTRLDATYYTETSVDLMALEPSSVRTESRKGWHGGRITFGGERGTGAVTQRDRQGRLMKYDSGDFYVGETVALDVIAGALRRAIIMCRE